jgi:hypothetical protein
MTRPLEHEEADTDRDHDRETEEAPLHLSGRDARLRERHVRPDSDDRRGYEEEEKERFLEAEPPDRIEEAALLPLGARERPVCTRLQIPPPSPAGVPCGAGLMRNIR